MLFCLICILLTNKKVLISPIREIIKPMILLWLRYCGFFQMWDHSQKFKKRPSLLISLIKFYNDYSILAIICN